MEVSDDWGHLVISNCDAVGSLRLPDLDIGGVKDLHKDALQLISVSGRGESCESIYFSIL